MHEPLGGKARTRVASWIVTACDCIPNHLSIKIDMKFFHALGAILPGTPI
jgi:hypothetical protein